MKKYEFIKRCFWGLIVAALVLFACLPAMAQGRAPGFLPADGPAIQRPVSDFLDVQGTFCVSDGLGGCLLANPPLPNFIVWRDEVTNRRAAVDYAGLAAEYAASQGLDFGTEVMGSVTELPMDDGSALVTVILHTTNAFTWIVSGVDTANGPVIFGNRFNEVLAGAEPALGDCTLKIEFFNFFPGAPLPDLVELLAFPQNGSIRRLRDLVFTTSALGEVHATFGVPEGTPGKATVTLLIYPHNGIGPAVPVNNIFVHPFGR